MIHAAIHFKRSGLEDDAATLARNVNGLAGYNCAKWLRKSLEGHAGVVADDEPIAEDWGWALVVGIGNDAFVLGCGHDPDDEGGWQVLLGDNVSRGILPWTRSRRRATLDALTERVQTFLRAQHDVSGVTVERL